MDVRGGDSIGGRWDIGDRIGYLLPEGGHVDRAEGFAGDGSQRRAQEIGDHFECDL